MPALARGVRDMSDFSRGEAAPGPSSDSDKARRALGLMGEALDLIDANDGPHDAGAFLDQAMCRLRDYLDRQGSGDPSGT